jgi:hypothetical protein
MNKEQWTFLAALVLLGAGVFLAARGWMTEKPVPTSQGRQRTGPQVAAGNLLPTVFPSEEEATLFTPGGRDPFRAKTELEDLPLPDLPVPPLTVMKRVAPGPVPGLGSNNLRSLEEAVAEGKIEFAAGAAEGGEGEGEGEGEEGQGGERRRW